MRKLLGSRTELSLVLIVGSIVLLVAIVVGDNMGNKVLGQIVSRASFSTTPVPIPSVSAGDLSDAQALVRRQEVLSVATDPGFPDPRITPEPPPPATPKPSPKPSPSPKPDDIPTPDADASDQTYTSPPLALPLVSHAPDESPDPQDTNSPRPGESAAAHPAGRGYPTLPPVGFPSANP